MSEPLAPPRNSTKRSLPFSSPPSTMKENKFAKTVDENGVEKEGSDPEVVEMGASSTVTIDTGGIHEVVLNRVKEMLAAYDGGKGDAASSVQPLVPFLTTAVTVAVTEAMKEAVKVMMKEVMNVVMESAKEQFEKVSQTRPEGVSVNERRLMTAVTRLTYDNDRLQQYTRRESMRIHGIKSEGGETAQDVERKVLKVFADAGAEVVAEDIAAAHRAGKEVRGTRPILVKFVSRRKRREVMEKKKELKDKEGYKTVFLNDDLTPLRARLLGYVKKLEGVHRAWTTDGKVMCVKKHPVGLQPPPRPLVIETPDDLFTRLGVTEVDFDSLGLSHLLCVEG